MTDKTTEVTVKANVHGPGLNDQPPQEMRTIAPDVETAKRKMAARAAHHHTELFGTDDPEEIAVTEAEVLKKWQV